MSIFLNPSKGGTHVLTTVGVPRTCNPNFPMHYKNRLNGWVQVRPKPKSSFPEGNEEEEEEDSPSSWKNGMSWLVNYNWEVTRSTRVRLAATFMPGAYRGHEEDRKSYYKVSVRENKKERLDG